MITGVLYGEKIFFGSVCAPNIFNNSFYSKLLADVTSVCRPDVVLDGDFNCGLLTRQMPAPLPPVFCQTIPLSQ